MSLTVRSARWGQVGATLVVEAVPQSMHQAKINAAPLGLLISRNTAATVSRLKLNSVLPVISANGFTLVEGLRVSGTTERRFQVQSATGAQQTIRVRFSRSLMARVDQVRGAHLWIGSRFWAFRAEAHLEAYLVESANYPPNGQLVIEQLSDDEMLLAAHWQD